MKKYKLNEKPLNGVLDPVLRVGAVSTRFFFREDDDTCYTLQSQIDYMIENGITEMDLFLAEREINSSYFFCKHFEEVGDKSECLCGKFCDAYQPKNGKSGICKYYGHTYEKTDRRFTLKLSEVLVFQNEC